MPTTVKAEVLTYENEDGVTYTYKVENEEKVTITRATIPTEVTEIVIPGAIDGKSVTSIEDRAFYGCSEVAEVTFEEGSKLETIGKHAFDNCSKLTSIEIPASVTSIGDRAFEECSALTTIEIPINKNSTIGERIFYGCGALKTVKCIVNNDVELLNSTTFNNNGSDITTIEFEENSNLKTIENETFKNFSRLTEITIPASVESIGANIFKECSKLSNIYVDEENTNFISENNIIYNKDKTELVMYLYTKTDSSFVIPNTVKTIRDSAFYNCSALTSIEIPSSIESIGKKVFNECSNLSNIYLDEENPNFISENNVIYNKDKTELVRYLETKTDSNYVIPDTVKIIRDSAFYNCSALTSIEIPTSVTNVGDSAFYNCIALTSIEIPTSVTSIGEYTFYNCSALTSIKIPSNVTRIGNHAFLNAGLSTVTFEEGSQLETIGDGAFYNCDALTSIEIPSNVTKLGDSESIDIYDKEKKQVFGDCNLLKEVTLEEGSKLEKIREGEFYNVKALTSIKIPSNVTEIGNYAFSDTGLSSVTFEEGSQLETIGDGAFYKCSALTSIEIPNSVTKIRKSAFAYTGLTSIEIPASITKIEGSLANWDSAFEGCYNLTTVTFEEGSKLEEIGGFAFCSALTSIEIPNSVTIIREDAFYNTGLTSIEIPANVKIIEMYAFGDCYDLTNVTFEEGSKLETIGTYAFCNTGLTSIEIPASVTTIGEEEHEYWIGPGKYTFGECYNLTTVKFEEGSKLKEIGGYTFENCTSLTEIEIPTSVTSIGKSAFSGCSALTSIEIPNSVITISDKAFSDCTELVKITIPSSVTEISKTSFKGRNENLVIACRKNSVAYNYAIENEIKYEILPFEATVSYSNTASTQKPVVATITLNEKLSEETKANLENAGWTYNEEELQVEKTYEASTEETITIIDWLGNYTSIHVKTNNIDVTKPEIKIMYNPTHNTKGKVTVIIVANEAISEEVAIIENEEIVRTEEWKHLTQLTPTMITKSFSENMRMQIRVKDLAGNYTETEEIEINNIKTDVSRPEIKYTPGKEEGQTNKNVIAEIDFTNTNEESIEILNNENEIEKEGLKGRYEFEKNGTYTFYYKDSSGNQGSITVEVDWIDKTEPKIIINNGKEETSYEKVKVEVQEENSYEIVITKNGEEIEYSENEIIKEAGNYEITVTDNAGNESKVKFEIVAKESKYETYEEEGILYIDEVSPETRKEDFIANLKTDEEVEVTVKGEELLEGKYVGTGMKATIGEKEYTIIVKGDRTGEGKANGQDALAILFHREGKKEIEGVGFKAVDLNKDGKINGMDALLLLLHRERQEGYIL